MMKVTVIVRGEINAMAKYTRDILEMALAGYEQQRTALEQSIADIRSRLRGSGSGRSTGSAEGSREAGPKKRVLSAAARRRMARAQKKRWAAVKKQAGQSQKTKSEKPKRTISAAGRKRIGDAARKRWAAQRKAGSTASRLTSTTE
jgi:hypothetical protein